MAKIAIPLASGFEDSEFTVPHERLREAGHEVTVFGTQAGETVMGVPVITQYSHNSLLTGCPTSLSTGYTPRSIPNRQ